ncbi:hypothetical protein [Desulforhabdus sp. TSK]|uniref:hypothetical protein n=1 Tax=Desulforhabdus sp. TSK TaxID=2925014 RepID=UPI001FC81555|nr:hypothetical protein [Desulforhabdus sp. TSK]GKT09139.1 hypothetical protein DSTSK_24440 [Desulforhabdus sp. TSK]
MAESCGNCGYAGNEDQAERCSMCGASLQARPAPKRRSSIGEITHEVSGTVPAPKGGGTSAPYPRRESSERGPQPETRASTATTGMEAASGNAADREGVRGRISHMERFDEPPPPNVYRTLSCLILSLLFGVPIMAVSLLLGIISLAFAIIGFAAISRLFNPYAFIMTIWHIIEIFVLGGIGRTDTIPVYRGMVETLQGEEQQFLFHGPIEYGNLVVGHHVRLTGTWREGTWLVAEGYDETVRSAITTRFRNRWRVFFFVLLFVLLAVVISGWIFYSNSHGRLPWL